MELKPKRLTVSYQKYVSYLLRHPEEVVNIHKEWFALPLFKAIITAIENFNKAKKKIILDELYEEAKQYYSPLTFDELDLIYKNFEDWGNIDKVRLEIKTNYHQTVSSKFLLEDFLVHAKSEGGFSLANIKTIKNKVDDLIYQIEDIGTLPSLYNLRDEYKLEIENRDKQPLSRRTYGFDFLDNHFRNTGLCNAGEMTLLVSQKGMGKSILAIWLANSIANRPGKIPVVYFSMEMGKFPTLDRLASIRYGYRGLELYSKNKTEDFKQRLFSNIDTMNNENFFLFEDATVSIEKIKQYISNVRRDLKAKDMLPPDGYMIIFLDLLTILQDFGNLSPQEVEIAMNRLNACAKEEGVHFFNIAQVNENKFRNGKIAIKKHEDLDFYKIVDEDIKGGAAVAERCRVVFTMLRRLMLKKKYFPEDMELWETQRDLADINITKNNAGLGGPLGFYQLSMEFDPYIITQFNPQTNTPRRSR